MLFPRGRRLPPLAGRERHPPCDLDHGSLYRPAGRILRRSRCSVSIHEITILAGAFTVGIGFGLQTVINNFVCGLILLFERPIKSRRCGAGRCGCRRGSADRDPGVRHPHGEWFGNYSAQRNAHLQQGQKLDFFGSVPGRRGPGQRGSRRASTTRGRNIEARRRRHPGIVKEPPPQAYAVNFASGTVSFQLRAWTDRSGDWIQVRSDLSVAIDDALTQQDIAIA